jgi:NADPH2:quinone reductase
MNHCIVALSRSPQKREQLTTMGAEIALNPSDSDWPKQLKTHLRDRRVDLAIDNVGGTLLPQMIETLGAHGKVSCVGRSAGVVPQFNTATLFFRQLRIGGVAVGAYTRPQAQAAWQSVVSLLNKTGDRPLIDSIHPFDNLPQAFDRLTHSPMGKVLLAVGDT